MRPGISWQHEPNWIVIAMATFRRSYAWEIYYRKRCDWSIPRWQWFTTRGVVGLDIGKLTIDFESLNHYDEIEYEES